MPGFPPNTRHFEGLHNVEYELRQPPKQPVVVGPHDGGGHNHGVLARHNALVRRRKPKKRESMEIVASSYTINHLVLFYRMIAISFYRTSGFMFWVFI